MTRIIEAILDINPNAKASVHDNDVNKIEWHDGTTPISKAEIENHIPVMEQRIKDAETKRVADKASADAKLKALGLTDDEIAAL